MKRRYLVVAAFCFLLTTVAAVWALQPDENSVNMAKTLPTIDRVIPATETALFALG